LGWRKGETDIETGAETGGKQVEMQELKRKVKQEEILVDK
jgi:hypothetical protein